MNIYGLHTLQGVNPFCIASLLLAKSALFPAAIFLAHRHLGI